MSAAVQPGAVLIALGREARAAESVESLGFLLVNRLRALLPYRQAILVEKHGGRWRVTALTGVATVERNAPFTVWVADVLRSIDRAGRLAEGQSFTAEDVTAELKADWQGHWPHSVVWLPSPAGRLPLRGLLLVPEGDRLPDAGRLLAAELCDIVFHAMAALEPRWPLGSFTRRRRLWFWPAAMVTLIAILAVPVDLTSVAPARIVPRDPLIVASPIAGVIRDIVVEPNAAIQKGDVLVRFETAELASRLAVADRSLAVAEAELLRARQQAFGDPQSNADVALKQAAVELRRTERDYAAWLMDQTQIAAQRSGTAIFASAADWAGRPVSVGERIMSIADPSNIRVEIDVPVADAVSLQDGAKISLILDIDPLHPRAARLERAAFEPEQMSGGVLAYRALANLEDGEAPPRIGLTGTARIAGGQVPLGLFLFRRPIAAARQWLGF